jgi:PAS domain S-box-containing protein
VSVILRDFETDPMFVPWRERAARHGLRSSVTVPFKAAGAIRGVLLVYAPLPDAFDAAALDVFEHLAAEMAFAIELHEDRQRLSKAEAELVAKAAEYKLLADHSSDVVVRYGRDGVLLYVSPSISQFGYHPEDLLGRTPRDLIHPDDLQRVLAIRDSYFSGRSVEYEDRRKLRLRTASGDWVWVEATPSIVRGPDGSPVEVISQLRDITRREAMEEELRRRGVEAEAAAHAKSEFLANMSHEIRTPLTAIVGFSEALRQTEPLSDRAANFTNRIAVAAQSLQAMVDQILDFSALDAGGIALDPFDLDPVQLVAAVCQEMLEPARTKGLELAWSLAPDVPATLRADGARLRQVLLGLLDNAVKFTERGEIRVRASYASGRLRIEVADTGVGIADHVRERLFELFFQADGSTTRRFGGAGIGLALAKNIVERMGGEIGFENRPGEGVVFWFTALATEAVRSGPQAPALHDGTPRVLVVDDAPANCELIGAMLEAVGCDCTFAYDGAQAVAAAGLAQYNLILMDMQMPVMDGPSAARAIRMSGGANTETPIVAVSANVLPMHVQACLEAGMDDHVPKPIAAGNLLSKVAHWLNRAT